MTSPEISPLRYPGGKGSLAPFFRRLLTAQDEPCEVFVEPFAGGAGAALRLLVDGAVESVVLNDLDPAMAAFWRAVVNHNTDFARLVETTPISIEAWHRHHEVHARRATSTDDLELGFSTFFLNRTNRSGIVNARPIGGLGQGGAWKLDARFNRQTLAARIRTIGAHKDRITVCQEDGAALVGRLSRPKVFIYADPPYLVNGADLYLNAMTWGDHSALAGAFARASGRWMVTYDRDDRVSRLYPTFRRAEFSIGHTAGRPHVGREYAVFGDRLQVPNLDGLGRDGVFVG
ncbi:MAG: DNA adenine methylase [Candidatus Limnocylindrales bacterium]|jgi:DNA adenine methylase